MRIDQCHEWQESVIGDSENPYLAIAFRNILHQPVDGVISIGSVIDRCGIEWAVQWAIHHVITLGVVFSAHVLHYPDVSALHDHLGCIVVTPKLRPEMRAGAMV